MNGRLDFTTNQPDIARVADTVIDVVVDICGRILIISQKDVQKTFYLIAVTSQMSQVDIVPMRNSIRILEYIISHFLFFQITLRNW